MSHIYWFLVLPQRIVIFSCSAEQNHSGQEMPLLSLCSLLFCDFSVKVADWACKNDRGLKVLEISSAA